MSNMSKIGQEIHATADRGRASDCCERKNVQSKGATRNRYRLQTNQDEKC